MGKLQVEVVEARDLRTADISGKSDPYAVIALDNQKYRTRHVTKNLSPQWNESFEFDNADPQSMLQVQLFDRDAVGRDDSLGETTVTLGTLYQGQEADMWLSLRRVKKGEVRLKITAVDFGQQPAQSNGQQSFQQQQPQTYGQQAVHGQPPQQGYNHHHPQQTYGHPPQAYGYPPQQAPQQQAFGYPPQQAPQQQQQAYGYPSQQAPQQQQQQAYGYPPQQAPQQGYGQPQPTSQPPPQQQAYGQPSHQVYNQSLMQHNPQDSGLEEGIISLDHMPKDVDDFVEMRDRYAVSKYGAAAMFVLAMLIYSNVDAEMGYHCLINVFDMRELRSSRESCAYRGFDLKMHVKHSMKLQVKGKPHVARAYIVGANPDNEYRLPDWENGEPIRVDTWKDKKNRKNFVCVGCSGTTVSRHVILERNDNGIYKVSKWNSMTTGVTPPEKPKPKDIL